MSSIDRNALIGIFLENLVLPPDKHLLVYKDFWVNHFNKQSLRLTKRGFVVLSKDLNLQYYSAHLKYKGKLIDENSIAGEMLVCIDRVMTCPWYLYTEGKMEIFGEKERLWLALHNDNIDPFLESWS